MRVVWMWGFMALSVIPVAAQVPTGDVRVLVLDALTGKPQQNVSVRYLCTSPGHNSGSKESLTGPDGFATFAYPCGSEERMDIRLIPPDPKEECGDLPLLTFKEIISTGVVARPDAAGNIWCPTKVSSTLKPLPGQVIMFVKKPTWWQSHVAG